MAERRLRWFAGFVLLWGAIILAKLISVQIVHHDRYVKAARVQQEVPEEILAPRGAILDRAGQPLALSVPVWSVIIDPVHVNPETSSDLLSRLLHLDRADLRAKIEAAQQSNRRYMWVKRRITPDEHASIRRQPVDYIVMEEENIRRYPGGQLAAHVLGSVDFEEKGNSGIEKALDDELQGVAGKVRLITDVNRRTIASEAITEARPGETITLTIDQRTQYVAERELAAAVQLHNAVSGSVVVMNPANGDILALASYPTYDPNLPPQPGDDPSARLNHAVSVPFEPGSVFKVMTLSAALETTDLRPDSMINCHGGILSLPGRVIHDAHVGVMGVVPMREVLAKSSNIGAIMIGMRVGQENMYNYVRRFGFGAKTGIPLPAESHGRLRKLSEWGKTSLASVSMGQEVSVTTLQLAQAGAVIASGGLLVKPRLLLKKGNKTTAPDKPVRVIQADTAATMREMMLGVVENGTGTKAQLSGYSVGGKTGSAQIFNFAEKRYEHAYNGSFMGFAPLGNPAIVVVVTLNGTHGESGFGGVAAAPVFHAVAAEALRILDVPKDRPEQPARNLVAKAQLAKIPVDGPPDDTGSGAPNILDDRDEGDDSAPAAALNEKVPNFRGMTVRAVLTEAAARGVTVLPAGSGIARNQNPPAGTMLQPGARIKVEFQR